MAQLEHGQLSCVLLFCSNSRLCCGANNLQSPAWKSCLFRVRIATCLEILYLGICWMCKKTAAVLPREFALTFKTSTIKRGITIRCGLTRPMCLTHILFKSLPFIFHGSFPASVALLGCPNPSMECLSLSKLLVHLLFVCLLFPRVHTSPAHMVLGSAHPSPP